MFNLTDVGRKHWWFKSNKWFQSQSIEQGFILSPRGYDINPCIEDETPPAVTEVASSQTLAIDEVEVDIESVHDSEEDNSVAVGVIF